MKKVNNHTRAGKDGKFIYCHFCKHKVKVYHFAWSALLCTHCNQSWDKFDWNLE